MRRPPGVLLGFSSESSIPSTPRAGLWVRTLKLPEKAEAALRGPQVRKWAGRAHRGSVSAATEPGLRDGTGWVCFAGGMGGKKYHRSSEVDGVRHRAPGNTAQP